MIALTSVNKYLDNHYVQYQYSHDIDWFFLDGQYPIHCASNGGLLPNNIDKTVELQSLQVEVENMSAHHQFELNIQAIEGYVGHHYEGINEAELLDRGMGIIPNGVTFLANTPLWIKYYSWSFAKMAQRGFFSFDRIESSNKYYLVACPREFAHLAGDVLNLIYKLPERTISYIDQYDLFNDAVRFVSDIDWIERMKKKDKM